MRIIKRWRINKPQLDESDYNWINGCCNKLESKVESHDFHNLVNHRNGQPISIAGRAEYWVDTINDEQESMLKLKYEGELTLMRVEHYDERDIQQRIDYYE